MSYRSDSDLEFLALCENDDLAVLVDIVKGEEGDRRFSQAITLREGYRNYFPNHKAYWTEIAEEIQLFGANSIATRLRGGQGVPYRVILGEVCDRLKIAHDDKQPVEEKEFRLLGALLETGIEKMSDSSRLKLLRQIGATKSNVGKKLTVAALRTAISTGGFGTYKVAVIVANAVARQAVGRGLSLAANATLTRTIGAFAGPPGWIVGGVWTAIDLAGPAFRVTIPAAVQISYMRVKAAQQKKQKRVSRSKKR